MKQSLMPVTKESGSHHLPYMDQKIKPLKKFSMKVDFGGGESETRKLIFKRCRVKNPKWASLTYEGEYDYDCFNLTALEKCKSLQLTSIAFNGLQTGGTVGHYDGKIKNLYKNSKYLKKLHFGAGAVNEERFIDLKRWIKKLKYVTDLAIVPYWFPEPTYDFVEDYHISFCRTAGVVDLIHFLYAQIKKLSLIGFYSEDIKNELDFKIMNRLEQFTIKVACRPEGCDGEHDEFGDEHIGFIRKAIKSETLKILTLHNQADATPYDFWKTLKKLILSIQKPLVIQASVDYRYANLNTNKLFKKIFADLPPNIKVTYSVKRTSYFLSLPSGFEEVGEDEGYRYSDDGFGDEDEQDNDENQEDDD